MARVRGWDLGAVALAKTAVSLGVLARGFVALSDDDFSRIVIAEQFAHAPSLDPSRTSWLPLPFWVHGAAMAAFGRSIATAHGTALVLGVVAALLVHRAALWLGASRGGAVLSAVIATGIPTAARLGVSAQPEALAAGLIVLGAATTRLDGWWRLAGAAALFAACLCRYEAWAAAAIFTLITLYDAARGRAPGAPREVMTSGFAARDPWDPAPPSSFPPPGSVSRGAAIAAALVAVAAPVAWIAHGAAAHGDPLFFLHRVAAYRRALGGSESLAQSLLAYPALLLKTEPELTFAAVAAFRIAADRAPGGLARLGRPALMIGGLFLFLVVGRALDGAPTHHDQRTLLPIWTLFAIGVGEGLVRAVTPAPDGSRGERIAGVAPALLAVLALSALCRMKFPVEAGISRVAELTLGYTARTLVGPDERLLIDTRDYGYFAVMAAFGAPERAAPIDRHDPRDKRSTDPFTSEEALAARLRGEQVRWLIVQQEHLPVTRRLGTVAARDGNLAMLLVSLP